ncbi:glycosyltransferase [Akkermansiaceae bacterium]|nr:glycosyltransferase [Akkermansiaceae bacterium]
MSIEGSITFLIDNLGSGGAQKQIYVLCDLLAQKGYQIKVLCYHVYGDDFYSDPLQALGVEVVHFELASYRKRILTIGLYLRNNPSEFVFSYLYGANILACLIKAIWLPKMKLIVSDRAGLVGPPSKRDKIRYQLYRFANRVFTNSIDISNQIIDRAPWLKKKTRTFWNIVEIPDSQFLTKNKKATFLIGASYHDYKNHLRFMLACQYSIENLGIDKNGFEVHCYGNFMLPDNAAHINRIQKQIGQLGLEDVFILHPATRELYSKMKVADFIVLPSLFEGCPNVIIEGMSMGKPVMASDVCANGYIIPAEGGYLFDPFSIDDMANQIYKALNTTATQRRKMGLENRKRCTEIFSAKNNLKVLEDALLEIK